MAETHAFEGRWSLITGGASGIGLACAQALAQEGSALVLLDVDAAGLAAARSRLSSLGVAVETREVDVSDAAALEGIAADLDARGVRVEHMVLAAGVLQPMHGIDTLDLAVHDRVWRINYHGSYHCCRLWGERMRVAGRGAIVTVSSVTAQRATPLLAYGPAKAALENLTASLSVAYAPHGVRINAVAPGFTLTQALQDKIDAGLRDADAILSQVPMGRFATPQEIAASVRFLLSDQAAAVTGTTLVVDCGWLAGSGWQTYQPMPRR
ncbi:MAG: SDR family oxidoreductase [Comamonadaceae bacterium]|uniref:SDR family NAD(P)-dependent oxidoreductase n=1 Tax=Hydrogenophaga sp. SNF1 TaxID=3098762 RepID=UPI002ACC082B|nr:SDR family oxidoreductase [Hydrogenophaga sp. SNF1]NCT96665.1 SDR family oxidoreductase [Comamonadaceae bacterium]WQB84703.1 SDR family oxidoreductase [Hydrogenophaga sp. SNF1]